MKDKFFLFTGGIRNFSHQEQTYEKWVLNRPLQAKIVESLMSMSDLDKVSSNPRKCLRPHEIKKSEEKVSKILQVMTEDFLSPFSPDLDKTKLYNLASGKPLPDDVATHLLSVEERGKLLFHDFNNRLCNEEDTNLLLFDPIKRVPWKGFADAEKKVKIKAKSKAKDVEVQRDILGQLVAISTANKAAVDVDKALEYPLAPVPLSLATSDGSRRKTCKSKLLDAALSSVVADIDITDDASCYIIDLVATIRSIVRVPNTFRDLALKLLNEIPRRYTLIYVACDTYADFSIKNAERLLRGDADEFIIKTSNIRIPPDFKAFLSNGANKERLFQLIEEVWAENAPKLGERVIYFARKNQCQKLSRDGAVSVEELQDNHEEADTKICYLLHHAHQVNQGEYTKCVVRSCSGDIDIPIILLGNELPNLHVLIDNSTGKNRKLYDLSACVLSTIQKQALVGLHAFTGNDYVSSFLRKGKKACWNKMKDNQEFLETFSLLGTDVEPSENVVRGLEKYVCSLYAETRLDAVNDARRKIFWRTFARDKKITDLSLLPPCGASLRKHIQRSSYVASLWRQANDPQISVGDATNHGWKTDLTPDWIDEPYPEDIAELLIESDVTHDSADDEDDTDAEYFSDSADEGEF